MVALANTESNKSSRELSVMVSDVRNQYAESLRVLLEPHGFTITRVRSGEDAIWLAERRAVDAAVLDSDLPDMPGVRVLRVIRATNPLIPIILVGLPDESGQAEHLLQTALELEAFSVLAQPVDLEVLLGQMARLFDLFFGSLKSADAMAGNPPVEPMRAEPNDGILRFPRPT